MSAGLLYKGLLALCLAIFLALISGSVAEDCGLGQQPNATDNGCEACPVGYYSDQTDNSSCTVCPDGKTTRASSSQALSDCIRNCPMGQQPNAADTACDDCLLGTYSNQTDATPCTACPEGMTTNTTASKQESDCFEKSFAVQTRPAVALYICFLLLPFFLFA